MERTITNNQILTLFLGLAIALTAGGCAGVPETQQAPAAPATATPQPSAAKTSAIPTKTNGVPAIAKWSWPQVDSIAIAASQTPAAETAPIADEVTPDAASADASQARSDNNLWMRIRAGLQLPKIDDDLTRPHEQWFIENAEFREAMFERSKLYLYYIVEEVEKRGMPMEIALLPAIESAYKPYAYSRARASGLWQFMPSTGRLYGLKTSWWYDGRRDIIASTRAALDYLQKLHDDFEGDWQLALAAYNAGEGRIARAIEWNRRHKLPTDFVHLRQLKRETKYYVPKLMAMVNIVSDPQRFGIKLPDVPNEPYFTRVETDSQVDLGVIARLTGMEVDDLHHINPGYTRRATDPNGPHHILVPVDKKDALVAGLIDLPEGERVQWLHHQVRRGDTLYEIARHYHLSVEAIKTANNLRGNALRIEQSLMLPISASVNGGSAMSGQEAKPVRIAAQADRPVIHRVRRGETLSSIARRYNVLVRQIAEWNLMRTDDILRLGAKLKIWTNDGPQALRHDPLLPVYA